MKIIAHVSDLHFGAEDPIVAEGLLQDLSLIAPSLLVVSGDLTQRARRRQFIAARQYLDRIPVRRLTVPGNHDVPLYDIFQRFLAPLKRYCRIISPSVDPWYQDEQIRVLGLNTARSLTWKSGRISMRQIELIRNRFCSNGATCFKILVTHHPFIPPRGDEHTGIALVGRAPLALRAVDECDVDLLLAGHLHHGYTGDVRGYYPTTKRSIIVAQAGTAISHRIRREPNAYNVIYLENDTIQIVIRKWKDGAFTETNRIPYQLVDSEWRVTENSLDLP